MIKLRNKKQIRQIILVSIALFFGIMIFLYYSWYYKGNILTLFDFKALDVFYKLAVTNGVGPEASFSPSVVYLNITDETYNFFDKNYLDRKDMATINNALSQMATEAVIYDIIFARKSLEASDTAFSQSLEMLGNVYLPTAIVLSDKPYKFRWKNDPAHERLRSDYLGTPNEIGAGNVADYKAANIIEKWSWSYIKRCKPFYGIKALTQQSNFAIRTKGSGDISAMADADGIYRHITMLIKIDDKYFPTLALASFLDWAGISLDDITVEWGKQITIPASKADSESAKNLFNKDVVIPIDRNGAAFIPFVNVMGKDFKYISANTFLTYFEDENMRGNLLEIFEGNFVFIGDIAIGTSDLGYTPLQNDAPLVITHASLLNALLTNTFYSKWQADKTFLLLLFCLTLLTSTSTLRSSWLLYGVFFLIIIAVLLFTCFEFISFRLFPIFTVISILLLIFIVLITILETSGSRERTFIRNTFARYVPEKVVNTLLAQPEMVTLGGEERVITVLFADIANFTTISESLSPTELVHLLNEYFTEMVEIIMQHGGIIDKFQGDSIMAEFGMPLPLDHHADRAVAAALQMLNRLEQLRELWKNRYENLSNQNGQTLEDSETVTKTLNRYDIYCRIGINTNNMIVGNMGSKTVLDYTVIGDAVNLASRLEGANKNYGTNLIISDFTYKQLTPSRFKTRILDYIRVKGKTEPVFVYEVYGETLQNIAKSKEMGGTKPLVQNSIIEDIESKKDKNEKINNKDRYYIAYEQGFESYLAQNFTHAKKLFKIALNLRPDDKASIEMLRRIDKIDHSITSNGKWDAAVSLMFK